MDIRSPEEISRAVARFRRARDPRPEPTPQPKTYLPVQWPASSTIDWELRNKLPKELVEKIDQSPVPVLVPGEVEVAKHIEFYPEQYGYYVDTGTNDLQPPSFLLDLSGHRLNTDPTEWPATHTIRRMPARITVSREKDTRVISWIENGILYEFEKPCGLCGKKDEASMLKFVSDLKYVGGSEAIQIEGGTQWQDGK